MRCGIAEVRWQGDASGLEQRPDGAGRGRAQPDLLAIFGQRDFLQPVEVAYHVTPFRREACGTAALVQLLLQHQGEKGAEHVAADGGSEEW